MGVNIYNSISIFKQDRSEFSAKEFESLKCFIFNSPWLSRNKESFISRFTPIIFDLTVDNLSIEVQFNTYNDWVIWRNIEHLYEITFPFYEFWFIRCYDNCSRDIVGSFKFLKINESDYPDTDVSNWRTCKYNFDKITIKCLGELPKSLQHIEWKKINQSSFESIGYDGQYFSNSEKSFSKGDNYMLTPDEGDFIALDMKYDRGIGGINYVWVEEEWYSDNQLFHFLKNDLKDSSVEQIKFDFNKRTTRIIEKSKYDDVLCFDGWDNCGDTEFLKYLEERKVTNTM